MNLADLGAGLRAVREAHRYCPANPGQGGHEFVHCPMYLYFREKADRQESRETAVAAVVATKR